MKAKLNIPHILVVDDEPDLAELFRQKFRKQIRASEMHFEFAKNGKEALLALDGNPRIGVIFTDLNMPEMNGLELMAALRSRTELLLKTIVISAYGDMPNIRKAMNEGAMDFMVKPIDLRDLSATLEKAVEEWQSALAGQEAALELITTRERAAVVEDSKRLQKEFFDNVTHELRTPLTLLLGPLETALDLPDRKTMLPHLEMARKHGHNLHQLIDELLEVARIDAGAMHMQWVQAGLKGFLQDLAASFEPLARARGIDFEIHGEGESLTMDFDPAKLRRAIGNLLANALKFTPEGGQVELGFDQYDEGEVRIWVQDNGPGIPENELERVFERFFRASEGGAVQVRGTGIGLALVRELVGLHGGQIKATSPAGARFEVTLPLRKEAEPGDFGTAWVQDVAEGHVEAVDEVLSEAIESAEENEGASSVLIVEDNADMRLHIRQSIGKGYQVREAENGALGLALAQEELPDLILSDVMMPEMDGHEFCLAIKSDVRTSHIPVVLLTARAKTKNRIEGLETGADAYLSKPFDREELGVVLKNLLESRKQLREKFREEFLLHPAPVKQQSVEDQFLQSLRKIMEDRLADEFFGVEGMAEELGMSRKTLHRKLSAIAGQSPNQFIRRYRLESAMQMLKNKTGPIGEIAYMTGFSSHSYFSKCFLEYFQISPSEI